MNESILDSIKKVCGIEADYTAFDEDLLLHINSEFAVLNQIGVGPVDGFQISDNTATWADILEGEMRLNMVKSYIYLKMRLLFDPPGTPPLIAAYEKQADMFLWRIREHRETYLVTQPTLPVDIDGGDAGSE